MEFEQILQTIHERFDTVPFMAENRMELCEAQPGRVRVKMTSRPVHLNHHGVIHGGYLLLLADSTAGLAALTDGRKYVTQSQNWNFLRGALPGAVYAEGTVLHRGRSVVVVRVQLTDAQGDLLGEGSFNMFVLDRPLRSDPADKATP